MPCSRSRWYPPPFPPSSFPPPPVRYQLQLRLRLRGLEVAHQLLSVQAPLSCQRLTYRALLTSLKPQGAPGAPSHHAAPSSTSAGADFGAGDGGGGEGATPAAPSGPASLTDDAVLAVLQRSGPFSAPPGRVLPRALQHGWRTLLADLLAHARTQGLLGSGGRGGVPVPPPTGGPHHFELSTDVLPLLALAPCLPDLALAQGDGGDAAVPPAPALPRALFPHRTQSMSRTAVGRSPAVLRMWLSPAASPVAHTVVDLKLSLVTALLQRVSMLHAQRVHDAAEGSSNQFLTPMAGSLGPAASPTSPGVGVSSLLSPIAGVGVGALGGPGATQTTSDLGCIDVTADCRVVASSNSRNASRVLDHARLLRDWVSNVSHYDGVAPRCHLGVYGCSRSGLRFGLERGKGKWSGEGPCVRGRYTPHPPRVLLSGRLCC
jgi:hypothetical protein